MGTVTALHRYPVKSMLGETLTDAVVTERGLHGDRMAAVLDEAGTVGSAKHPRKWGPLLTCRSRMAADLTITVQLPDGTDLPAGDPHLDARLSALLGRRVALSATPPEHGGLLERAVPDYRGGIPDSLRATASTDTTGAAITSGSVAPGTFFDYGTVHLVTTATLARLHSAYPAGDFDPRRFRPNLVVDTLGEPGFVEDAWIGIHLRVGEALLRPLVPTPRCVIPTLGQDGLPPDPRIMRTVASEHRIPVLDLGRLSCVGVYLDVVEPGTVRVGDPVTREDGF
ncbi:MOSC domain-containing protein [Streptomyces sp. NK08204]|uniref:MOSC domain-containing protein n=1 Tax=Streptomyces sp. NK08204 TaxID=2873260 RepID=UPI001CEC6C63|nr:MOSC domain-containing protein [Streptomyces sp. NK08204]